MTLNEVINFLENECENPCKGLPEEVFLLLTRLTPMVNVDLLIKDDQKRTLQQILKKQRINSGVDGMSQKTKIKKTLLVQYLQHLNTKKERRKIF